MTTRVVIKVTLPFAVQITHDRHRPTSAFMAAGKWTETSSDLGMRHGVACHGRFHLMRATRYAKMPACTRSCSWCCACAHSMTSFHGGLMGCELLQDLLHFQLCHWVWKSLTINCLAVSCAETILVPSSGSEIISLVACSTRTLLILLRIGQGLLRNFHAISSVLSGCSSPCAHTGLSSRSGNRFTVTTS